MAKNVLQEMNTILYDSLTKLSDSNLDQEQLKEEIIRSNAITNTAKEIINNVRAGMEIMKYADKKEQSINNVCKLLGVTVDED